MALGATPSDIMRVTVLRTLAFALVGVSAGLAVSIATGQLLHGLLYGVSPMDPWAGFSGAALIIATAATATILPAVRVARLDPSTTLRYPT
jgi:ABC-type antimicrobial peptide transport system permease subunit